MRSPLLLLALAIHLVMAGSYAWRTPAFEGPDENSHYEYAWHIANARKLPINPALAAQRGLPQVEGCVLAHHPPLYYTLLATVLRVAGRDDAVFGPRNNPNVAMPKHPGRRMFFLHEDQPPPLLVALRFVSVLLGAGTIVVVFAFARVVVPDVPAVAGTAAVAVASLPMFSFLHGVLNSDALATLLSSATLLVCAQLLRAGGERLARFVTLGALLGLAALSKSTTLFLGGVAAITGLSLLWRARGTPRLRATFARLAVAAAIALALCGWQFWRSWSLYGDPLGMNAHDASFQVMPPAFRWPYLLGPLYTGDTPLPPGVPSFVPDVFTSLLGRFGWFTTPPAQWTIWFGAALTATSLLGVVAASFPNARRHLPRPLWLLLLPMALVLLGTAWFNTKVAQPQGRLLFPAIAPAAALFAAGLVRATSWLPQRRWLLAAFPAVAIAAFATTFVPAFDPADARARRPPRAGRTHRHHRRRDDRVADVARRRSADRTADAALARRRRATRHEVHALRVRRMRPRLARDARVDQGRAGDRRRRAARARRRVVVRAEGRADALPPAPRAVERRPGRRGPAGDAAAAVHQVVAPVSATGRRRTSHRAPAR